LSHLFEEGLPEGRHCSLPRHTILNDVSIATTDLAD